MKPHSKQLIAGFTMVEMLVVIAIVGILAAISAPNWQAWLTRQRINSAQSEALTVLRQAQANAKREKRIWQVCFRDDGNKVRWNVSPVSFDVPDCSIVSAGGWENLIGEDANIIGIDTSKTTLRLGGISNSYAVLFQYKGLLKETTPPLTGTITFGSRQTPGSVGVRDGTKRCVRVETLLGAMSLGNDNDCPTPSTP